MNMDEKFKQVKDWQNKIDAELCEGIDPTDRFEPHDRNEEIRIETMRLQLGIRKPVYADCVTVRTSDGELDENLRRAVIKVRRRVVWSKTENRLEYGGVW